MDIRRHYEKLLASVEGKPFESTSDALDKYLEICNGCVALATEYFENHDRMWEIAPLVRTCLHYAGYLEEFDHMLNALYQVLDNMSDCVFEHPRLKLQLLNLLCLVLRRIESLGGHELGLTEDVCSEIRTLQRNIEYADKGEFESISDDGVLKRDPVEWTAAWEEAIDEADRIAYGNLEGLPRGMGFCFAFWYERKNALGKMGIEWKTPHQMNPRVLFD